MYSLVKRFFFALEPELAHAFVKRSGALVPKALLSKWLKSKSPRLKCRVGGVECDSPIGLAAGFDKNAEMIPFMAALGFGFVEIGSVTALPCEGNPRPRIFRLTKDESIINRMGLPNQGADVVAERLGLSEEKIPLGINIAKTPDMAFRKSGRAKWRGVDDFVYTFGKLHSFGACIVLNLSCPNTSDGRTFEDPAEFEPLAEAILSERKRLKVNKPLLLKLSPDMDARSLEKFLKLSEGFDGYVISNTTAGREGLKTPASRVHTIGKGGLSGAALKQKSLAQLKRVAARYGRNRILMAVGGIMSFEDLVARLAAGATHFQVYTGLIYRGPFFINDLNRQLDALCQKEKVSSYYDLVGRSELVRE